jgi:RNA 3'-terminal phosphate cyclase
MPAHVLELSANNLSARLMNFQQNLEQTFSKIDHHNSSGNQIKLTLHTDQNSIVFTNL